MLRCIAYHLSILVSLKHVHLYPVDIGAVKLYWTNNKPLAETMMIHHEPADAYTRLWTAMTHRTLQFLRMIPYIYRMYPSLSRTFSNMATVMHVCFMISYTQQKKIKRNEKHRRLNKNLRHNPRRLTCLYYDRMVQLIPVGLHSDRLVWSI